MAAPTSDERRRRQVLAVLGIALGLRLLALGGIHLSPSLSTRLVPPDTQTFYRPLALGLLGGEGYAVSGSAREATRIAPAFPLFLAAAYALLGVDASPLALGALNVLLRTLSTLLVFVLGERLLDRRAAVLAALLHALDPWEGFWAAFVLKESLAVLLALLACVLVARTLAAPTWRAGLGAGAALGLAVLARYASLVLVPWAFVLFAWRLRRERRAALRVAAATGLGLALALGPWLLWTSRALGEPGLSLHFVGRYFYVANGPGTEQQPDVSGYAGVRVADDAPVKEVERWQSAGAGDRALLRRGLEHVLTHPGAAARVAGARLVSLLRPTFEGSSWLNLAVLGLPWVVLVALAGAGLWIGLRRGTDLGVPVTALAFYLALHVALFADVRFRQYFTPFLDLLGGLALSSFSHARVQRPRD